MSYILCVMVEPTAADLPSQSSWGFGHLGRGDITVLCSTSIVEKVLPLHLFSSIESTVLITGSAELTWPCDSLPRAFCAAFLIVSKGTVLCDIIACHLPRFCSLGPGDLAQQCRVLTSLKEDPSFLSKDP